MKDHVGLCRDAMGAYRGWGFRDVTPTMEKQIKKNMNN